MRGCALAGALSCAIPPRNRAEAAQYSHLRALIQCAAFAPGNRAAHVALTTVFCEQCRTELIRRTHTPENFREARYAHSLGDHHRFCRGHYRAPAGAWTKQSSRFHSHDAARYRRRLRCHFHRPGGRLVPARSGRGPDRRRRWRADRLVRLAPPGFDARYPRPRRPTLALGWTVPRRCDLRSTTTARASPPRPGMVNRLSGRRIFRTARLASSTGTDINAATISIWPSRSSVRPCAAKTASSSVGGSRRTRRKPSFVSQTSLTSHLVMLRIR